MPAAKSRDAKNREVIAAAKRTLKRALEAHATIVEATDNPLNLVNPAKPDLIEGAWNDFLVYSSSVFEKLKYGKKTIDEAWFKQVEDTHKTDELLVYLRHARNTVEHGLDRGVHRHEPYVSVFSTTLGGPRSVPPSMPVSSGLFRSLPKRGENL